MPRISRETPPFPRAGKPDEGRGPGGNAGQAPPVLQQGALAWSKPLPSPSPYSSPDAHLTYMVLKGHILPGYTHVGLGNARLDNHFSQELRIEPPAGVKRRMSPEKRAQEARQALCEAKTPHPQVSPLLGQDGSPRGSLQREVVQEDLHREQQYSSCSIPAPVLDSSGGTQASKERIHEARNRRDACAQELRPEEWPPPPSPSSVPPLSSQTLPMRREHGIEGLVTRNRCCRHLS